MLFKEDYMSEIILNPLFTCVSGRLGGIVIYRWNGKFFTRRYVRPRNPDTEAQRSNRSVFSDAVRAWRELSTAERTAWNSAGKVKKRRGYNLFISDYMNGSGRSADSDAGFEPAGSVPAAAESVLSGLLLRSLWRPAPLALPRVFGESAKELNYRQLCMPLKEFTPPDS